jgi:hypothetical protein
MTEIVGLVASGINIAQLAGQVANSVIELMRLWSLVREAPSDIKDHAAQVESKFILDDTHDPMSPGQSSADTEPAEAQGNY